MATDRRFAQLLTQHIENTVSRKFTNEHLNNAVMHQVRQTVRGIIDNVFDRSNHELSETGRAWLVNQLFKRIKVNGDQLMNDLIVINEYKLAQLTYHDVELLSGLFDQTDLAAELNDEYRTRRAS
jgi:hypothetical protein